MTSTYDHFAQNPGFKLWNVVNVKKPNDTTWEISLIGRDKEMIATVCIRKLTMAQAQEGVLSLNCACHSQPLGMKEDCGMTIVDRNTIYETYIQTADASKETNESSMKRYLDAGLEDNVIYKMVKRNYDTSRTAYEMWKALPQTPLENPINTWEPRKCYFGLPHIVYMHLVGQLCANI